MLIEAGAEVDPEPQDGDSPLMRAILKQRYTVAEHLLLAGADAGSKLTKAEQLGVRVISESDFVEYLESQGIQLS